VGHVVVCGLHDEGLRLVEQLATAGVAAVVVDDEPDPRLVGELDALGVPHLVADSREPAALQAAGVAGAIALVCVESDDLHTLATALLARELRPGLRVVVELGNAAVGRALGGVGIAVLDAAGLAAPSIVDACLLTGRRELWLGESCTAVEVAVGRDGTLRELYGDLVPVAVLRSGGGVEVAPGRDVAVGVGDAVVVLGTTAEVVGAGLISRTAPAVAGPVFVSARAPGPARVRRASLVRTLVRGLDRRVKIAVAALVALAGVSMTVLLVGYQEPDGRRMSPLDALYFTIETIGTVGYGDFYFRDQPWWLRAWAIVLMVVGATLATVFFALLTNALVSRRLEATLGSRRITGLEDHVVLVGMGSVGLAVARSLIEQGVDVVVVERDEANRFLGEVRSMRLPVVLADATLPDTWRRVQLDRARAVAVMTAHDLANIETGLAVRDLLGDAWARVPVVLRLFDRRLASTVRSSFDFRHVRSPAALAAPWFVGAVLGLDVLDVVFVGDQPLLVARLSVGAGLDGVAMRELGARIRVVSLDRAAGVDGGAATPGSRRPRRDTRLAAGDTAYLVGPYDELLDLLRRHGEALPAGVAPRSPERA
jgi:Trk K+ transport system NAD-binding subunit